MGVVMSSCANETGGNGNRVNVENNGSIYHEKQSKELCALHALNNLFQNEKAYTKKDLDDICYKLSPLTYINPHKSMFGLGNYDINVIMAALQKKDYDTVWFDKRKDLAMLSLDLIEGFILNIPTDYKLGMVKFPIRRKHWIAIRQIGQHYYNLDSKLEGPEVIGGRSELVQYLGEQVKSNEKELLLVVSTEIAQEGTWYQEDENVSEEQNFSAENKPCDSHQATSAKVERDVVKLKLSEENATQEDNFHAPIDQTGAQTTSIKINCKPAVGNISDNKNNASNEEIKRASSSADKYEVKRCDSRNSEVEFTSHS